MNPQPRPVSGLTSLSGGLLCALLASGLLLQGPVRGFAQRHQGSPHNLAADMIRLDSGEFLYGIVIHRDDSHTDLLVLRDWLQEWHPQWLEQADRTTREDWKRAGQQLLQRIDQWREETGEDLPDLRVFLEDERARIAGQLDEPDAGGGRKLARLRLENGEIGNLVVQAEPRHRLLGVAWKHELDQAATRPAGQLVRELNRRGIDPASEPLDTSGWIPPVAESDEAWAIRRALVEFERGDPLRLQGSGTTFFRHDQQPGLATLLGQLAGAGNSMDLVRQIGEELEIPEFTAGQQQRQQNERDWWKKPAAIADGEGRRVFEVTRLNQNLLDPSAGSVSSHVFVKRDDGSWQPLFRTRAAIDPRQVDQAELDALREDPQIRQIGEVFSGLAGGNLDQPMELALRHGAATGSALREVRSQTAEFTGRYRQRLDGPPIKLTTADSDR